MTQWARHRSPLLGRWIIIADLAVDLLIDVVDTVAIQVVVEVLLVLGPISLQSIDLIACNRLELWRFT